MTLPSHHPTLSISIDKLTAHYGGIEALHAITFDIYCGQRVAVVGPNGAGKSTLFKAIAGTLSPTNGQVHLFEDEAQKHACVAYLPQRSQVDLTFPVNVWDVVMMGRVGRIGPLRWPGREDKRLVTEALTAVAMRDFAKRHISELSGGQLQRVFIARAIAQQAQIVLMDEPLTGLDVHSQENIYHILDTMQAQGVTVLVATHDLHQAAERFDLVLLLNRTLVGFGLPQSVFTPMLLQQAYGGAVQVLETNHGAVMVTNG